MPSPAAFFRFRSVDARPGPGVTLAASRIGLGMPFTNNVAWDGNLEAFKGRDTAQYTASVMALASRRTACKLPLGPGAALSLSVVLTPL